MGDDFERISEALGVPTQWLLGLGLLAFAMLFAAIAIRNSALAVVAAAFGILMSLIGVRAAIRPSRPFRLENFAPWINTTRRVGAFYVVAGLVWALLAVTATGS